MNYVVVYEKTDTGWGAYSPDLPGLVAEGETLLDVQELIRETMELHFEGVRREGDFVTRTVREYTPVDNHA